MTVFHKKSKEIDEQNQVYYIKNLNLEFAKIQKMAFKNISEIMLPIIMLSDKSLMQMIALNYVLLFYIIIIYAISTIAAKPIESV